MNNNNETIGSRIKEIRNLYNLTQKEFGEKIHISYAHVSGIEADKKIPSDSVIKLICMVFNVSEKWLRRGEGSKIIIEDEHVIESFFENKENPLLKIIKNANNENFSANSQISLILDSLVDIVDNPNIPQDSYLDYLKTISTIFISISCVTTSFEKNNKFNAVRFGLERGDLDSDINKLFNFFTEIEKKKVR